MVAMTNLPPGLAPITSTTLVEVIGFHVRHPHELKMTEVRAYTLALWLAVQADRYTGRPQSDKKHAFGVLLATQAMYSLHIT
jgi:hypothetical protein